MQDQAKVSSISIYDSFSFLALSVGPESMITLKEKQILPISDCTIKTYKTHKHD
jgi:hypothetical protein